MGDRILIINYLALSAINKEDIDTLYTRRKLSFFERFLLKTPLKEKLSKIRYVDKKNWWKTCENYKIIILMDSTQDILYQSKRIEETVTNDCRLIFFRLNPASHNKNHNKLSSRWEHWSFSKKESLENHFRYGETFYLSSYLALKQEVELMYDAFFIGLDKGRRQTLLNLKSELYSLGINSLFLIVDNSKYLFNKTYSKRLAYPKIIHLINKSKCIIDIVQENQEGMTLRVMESLFFKKKLITNNIYVKTRSFYSPNNIFILGQDNIINLPFFINTPYEDISETEVNKYEFSNWLHRIVNNKEFDNYE